jgi:RecA-family ATPase
MEQYELSEIINHIDPAVLNYNDWLAVGMGLKESGYSVALWDTWSQRDPKRYHPKECAKKWAGFNGASLPVTAGTIVQIAKNQGWTPHRIEGRALDWDDWIGGKDELVIINPAWVESKEVAEPDAWDPIADIIKYLETLFDSTDNVGYVTESWEKDGQFFPKKGYWDRSAGELIEQLKKCNGDISNVFGDYHPSVGAWIRFNPLDGKDCKNDNVTDYRFALVESDSMELDQQNAIIRELELPVACLVHSGGKSLHAIVRIDAQDYTEYRKRVERLYEICKKNGFIVDGQNKNPSRLSRMPGVIRNGNKQYLVDTNIGKSSWKEWEEWIESVNDDLPEPENLVNVWNDLPELAPPLINGILRQGHKMLLAGPSKAGKSYLLIELCCAIAEGQRWIQWQCAQGRVLYVNLELDRASCLHRFKEVYEKLGLKPQHLHNIDIWNLRGKALPMDKLAPKMIRRALKKSYVAVIIDPIYKVITGDENSADQMARFCNQFDLVCHELGASVIYCHHHSKGQQGQKRSMDRASGSGVFARDPDALLDLLELEMNDQLIQEEENNAACEVYNAWLNKYASDWENEVSQDDQLSEAAMKDACIRLMEPSIYAMLKEAAQAAKTIANQRTAWRIEGTMREFAKFDPVNLWFNYPIHYMDQIGVLDDIAAESEKAPWQRGTEQNQKNKPKRKQNRFERLKNAIEFCSVDGPPTAREVAEYLGITSKTVRNWIHEGGVYYIDTEDEHLIKERKEP